MMDRLNIQLAEWKDYLTSPELLQLLAEIAVIIVAALFLSAGLKRVLNILGHRVRIPRMALTPIQILLRYGIWIVAVILILGQLGLETDKVMTAFLTILGLVAIGFVAVWSVLSNFLCTFVLIVFKPFSVGDEVEIPADSVKGTVVDLSLLYTTLRTADGLDVQIPNNMFFQKIFKRRSGTQRVDLEEQLRSDTPTAPAETPLK